MSITFLTGNSANMLPVFREDAGEGQQHGQGAHNPHRVVDSDSTRQWGERDAGEPVDFRLAMQQYEGLQRELSTLSQSKSHTSRRSKSGRKRGLTAERQSQQQSDYSAAGPPVDDREVETPRDENRDAEKDEVNEEESDFELTTFLRDGHFEKRVDGASAKKVGVVFRNLIGETPLVSGISKSPNKKNSRRSWSHNDDCQNLTIRNNWNIRPGPLQDSLTICSVSSSIWFSRYQEKAY